MVKSIGAADHSASFGYGHQRRLAEPWLQRAKRSGRLISTTSCTTFGDRNGERSRLGNQRTTSAFTLVELLIVIAIVSILFTLIAPAFVDTKRSNDITAAAYAISGALETARTYAKANNTYTWIGFFEEDGSKPSTSPPTAGSGRVVISIVASKDGTNIYGSNSGPIDPTRVTQFGKLIKVDNVHLPLFSVGTGNGDTFDTRPLPDWDVFNGYNDSRLGELNSPPPNTAPPTTPHNFQYPVGNPAPKAEYTFKQILQFGPRGETRLNGDSYDIRHVVEIGLVPTHGNLVPAPASGAGTSNANYNGNVAAIQITGFGGAVKIYRR